MTGDIETKVSTLLRAEVTARRLVSEGLSEIWFLRLSNGRRIVAKRAPLAEAEAEMLEAIRATGCPAPEVCYVESDLILMSRLDDGGMPGPSAWAHAGEAVARLHGSIGDTYGWTADHAFGSVVIPNAPTHDWPTFWAERRLLAHPDGVPRALRTRLESLAAKLTEILPAAPSAARLHGDLWSGNLIFGANGFSGLIDPACAYGDGHVDLAMLTLFGRPPPCFFEGYGVIAEDWESLRPVYQLWPALVHLRLFGAGYRGMVESLLDETGF